MAGYGSIEEKDFIEGLDLGALTKSGLWGIYNHYRETGERNKTLKAWTVITIVIYGPLVILSILAPIYTDSDFESITLNLLNPLSVIQVFMKAYFFWYCLEYQCQLLDLVKKDFLSCIPLEKMEEAKEILGKLAKKSNLFPKIAVTANFITCAVWIVLPILRSEFFRLTLGITIFGTPTRDNKICGFWYPINYNSFPWIPIIFVYEAFIFIWGGFTIALQVIVISQLVTLLTGHIKVFNYIIDDLKLTSDWNKDIEVLLMFVKEHQKLTKVGDDMKGLYNWFITMQLATGIIILIISIFNFFLGSGNGDIVLMIKFVSFTMYPLAEVAVYCYAGDDLETRSGEVTAAAYGSEWYLAGVGYRKTVLMLMMRSQRTLNLEAGKLYPVNLLTLTSILRMTYSISMLMYRMTSSE